MAQAYVPIQTVTVGSGGSSTIEFTNIPQTYTDLVVRLSIRNTSTESTNQIYVQPNSATTNLSSKLLAGTGSTALSASYTSASSLWGYCSGNGSTSNTFGNSEFYFPNYASANYKSVRVDSVNETNATDARQSLLAGLWSSTTAISSLKFLTQENSTGNAKDFVQYSTATLYGIGGTRASGGTVTADGRYTYHTFTSTGTFTANEKIKGAEILVIAGGGGGGNTYGGGGGAGGVSYSYGNVLNAGSTYTVVIGAGGTGSTSRTVKNSGSNSLFGSVSATGGGAGGSYDTKAGANGGSGGGGAGESGSGGTATSGQGNNGGSGSGGHGGGGGGAAGTGGNAGASNIGNGGAATSTYSAWHYATSTGVSSGGVYYVAGGGSGGSNNDGTTLGTVSGGAGQGQYSNGNAATANTGSGGGGGGLSGGVDGNGGAGGSGLVIIRYLN